MIENDSDADAGKAIRQHGTRFETPAGLREDILADIAVMAKSKMHPVRSGRWDRWLFHPALTFAAGAVCASIMVAVLLQTTRNDPVVEAMVADHARSVVTGQTIEVASANTHTVKPWLSEKLGYSPVVMDLSDIGYPLVGGRRGFIGRIPVGVMVYQVGQHEIDVYALPSIEFPNVPHSISTQAGYHLLTWETDGIRYVVMSDAGPDRLRIFSDTLQQRQSTRPIVD